MKYVILTVLFLLYACPGHAEVMVSERNAYFSVRGKTPREIKASIRKNSPSKGSKTYALAQTRTSIRYEIKSRPKSGGRCATEDVVIYLDLTYIYPKLDKLPTSKRTLRWWKAELKDYQRHEQRHGIISKELARKLDREINKLNDLNCSTMADEIQRRVRYYQRKIQKKHEEFDRKDRRY